DDYHEEYEEPPPIDAKDGGTSGFSPDGSGSSPDVTKRYVLMAKCAEGAKALTKHIQSDFASFANYTGSFGFLGLETGDVQFSPGPITAGGTVSIHTELIGPIHETIDTSVKVTEAGANQTVFTTVPGHVLYPAAIAFTAVDVANNLVGYTISV